MILWPLNWFLLTLLFSKLGTLWNGKRFPEATFALTASWLYYTFPALLPGGATAIYIANRALRLIIGEHNYQEYNYYVKRYSSFIIIVILSGIIPLLALVNWYVLFTPEHIVIKPWYSITRTTWNYSDIESIRTAPAYVNRENGREVIVHKREYIIKFRNEEKFTTGWGFPGTHSSPARLNSEQKAQILAYVSQKSGVPITEMDVLNPYEP